MHYERSQNRAHIYSEQEFLASLKAAGFEIKKIELTYGALGILGHEIYSLLLMGMGNAGWFGWIFIILLPLFSPLILGLKWIDFLQKKETGNGLLVVVSKGKKTGT